MVRSGLCIQIFWQRVGRILVVLATISEQVKAIRKVWMGGFKAQASDGSQ
jgi:hypothetical protein